MLSLVVLKNLNQRWLEIQMAGTSRNSLHLLDSESRNSILQRPAKVYLTCRIVEKQAFTIAPPLMKKFISETGHRPWPLERGPWVMAQTWHDLLFAHWPVPVATLRRLVSAALEIDTFDSIAWLAVVPFRMSGVRVRGTPSVPWLSNFLELNVRTYVVHGGKPGVWFFSLDAENPVAVEIARRWFHLPYFRADMHLENRDDWFRYESTRAHRGAPAAVLRAKYRPIGAPTPAVPGTLEHFLTERYCLYTTDHASRLIRGEIHHDPWPLQVAEAEFAENTMDNAAGIALPARPPVLHFAHRQDVVVWPPERIT
jgi:uncharacterized protein